MCGRGKNKRGNDRRAATVDRLATAAHLGRGLNWNEITIEPYITGEPYIIIDPYITIDTIANHV